VSKLPITTVMLETHRGLISIVGSDTTGYCGAGNWFLFAALRAQRYNPTFVLGEDTAGARSHCWVEVPGDRPILDITAEQFGRPSVFRSNIKNAMYYQWFFDITAGRAAEDRLAVWFLNPAVLLPNVRDYVKTLKKGTLHYNVWSSILVATEKYTRRAASY
jgi:hypothetical protein